MNEHNLNAKNKPQVIRADSDRHHLVTSRAPAALRTRRAELGNFRENSGKFGNFPTLRSEVWYSETSLDDRIIEQEATMNENRPEGSFWKWKDAEAGQNEAQCTSRVEPDEEVEDPSEDWMINLELLYTLQSVGELSKQVMPALAEEGMGEWADATFAYGYGLYEPSRGLTHSEMAEEIATLLGDDLIDALSEYRKLADRWRSLVGQRRAPSDRVKQLQEENAQLRRENAALLDRTRQVKSKCVIPAQKIVVNSPVHQHILRLIGEEGLGRSWRIRNRVIDLNGVERRSVTNAITRLTKKGLIEDYSRDGKSIRWKCTTGGSRRLILLTERGAVWYREAHGREPVESEIVRAARTHRSAVHGVGVLEARDHLRAAGYTVDDDPEAILEYEDRQWRRRMEPDLIVQMDGTAWPVEVQREVSQRLLKKWEKALALAGRLALVLFNVAHRERQEHILRRARRLPRGTVCLTSLEEMEAGDWEWVLVNASGRR
jgi:DNA-binding transcriptional ArsR family regulator